MKTSMKLLSFGALLAVLVGLIGVGPLAGIRVAQAAPAIAVGKVVTPTTAAPGDMLTYTYRVTNTGDITLTGVVALDNRLGAVPLGAATLLPGAWTTATLTYTVVEADLPGPLTNTVAVTGTPAVGGDVYATANAAVTLTSNPAIVVAKAVTPTTAAPGDMLTYTYRVTNTGDVTLVGVVALDNRLGAVPLGAGLLAPGAWTTATLTYTVVEADLPGPLTNTVAVTGTPPVGGDVHATANATVTLTSNPAIAVGKAVTPTTAAPGDMLTYTYRVTNTGDVTLVGVVALDNRLGAVPLGVTTLAPGASTTGVLNYTVVEGDLPGPLVNTVVVTGTPPVGGPVNATANAAVTLLSLPVTTCTLTAPGQRSCDLWATTGSITLPGPTAVPIWGYTDQVTGTAQLPGPVLIANQGETLTIVLHNTLAETTSLVFPGQDIVPDLVGVAPGGTVAYTFVAANPGTFVYEAGLTPYGARQVAMGLFGALIVRPAGQPTWAYDDPATAFDDEALLIINEIDPAFNADPANFSMLGYSPKFWLLNGAAYPDTLPIPALAGHKVLLRQINAGIIHRPVGLLGLHQTIIANDGSPLTYPYQVAAITIPAGETMDTLTMIPANAPSGAQYAFRETGQHVRNAGQLIAPGGPLAFGGILTFITVPTTPPGPDLLGPLAGGVLVTPNPTAGTFGVTLTATLSDQTTGAATVVGGEYFTDTMGAPGTGMPFSIPTPTITVTVALQIPPAALSPLPSGEHVYYLRGRDDLGNWGPVGSAAFELVVAGPVVEGIVLTPGTGNGTQDIAVRATGDARPMGPADVVQAEFFIDTPGGNGTGRPMVLNQVAPIASLTATIPMGDVAALTEGIHPLYIHALDSLGNWGGFTTADLRVDKTGPGASGTYVYPTPNNGYRGVMPSLAAVRVQATFGDPVVGGVNSNLDRAEGFIDTIGADGSGFQMTAVDGAFHLPVEDGYQWVPLFTIAQLPAGPHTFYVHAKDIAGNWGTTYGEAILIVDKTGPDVTNLDIQPNPTRGSTGVTLTATAADPPNPGGAPSSNIVAAEWFDGIDPGGGLGNPVGAADGTFDSPTEALYQAISVIGWRPGDHVISVRALDEAGNWGPSDVFTLTVRGGGPNGIFADGFESGNTDAWSGAVGAVNVVPGAAMGGTTYGMAATVNGTAPAYVVDSTPNNEARYWASFYFNPNGADTAAGQHDIFVAYDPRGIAIFGIQYQHQAGGGFAVRAWALHELGVSYSSWYDIGNTPHRLGIWWESGTEVTVRLFADKQPVESISDLETNDYLVDEVWLGPSLGLTDGMSGVEYLDEFSAIRGIFDAYLPLITR